MTYSGRRFLATVADYGGLPPPSPEQDLVVKALKQGRNARVNAVAGSGKTTTILQIAQAFPNRRILGIVLGRGGSDGSAFVQSTVKGGYAISTADAESHEQYTSG